MPRWLHSGQPSATAKRRQSDCKATAKLPFHGPLRRLLRLLRRQSDGKSCQQPTATAKRRQSCQQPTATAKRRQSCQQPTATAKLPVHVPIAAPTTSAMRRQSDGKAAAKQRQSCQPMVPLRRLTTSALLAMHCQRDFGRGVTHTHTHTRGGVFLLMHAVI